MTKKTMKAIKTDKLKKALELVKPGLSNKEIVEQSTSFAFIKGNVVSYNDEISVRCPIDLDIEGAIPAEPLFAFVSRAPGEEISLKTEESEIKLRSGRARAGIRLERDVTLPLKELGQTESGDWIDVPDDFIPALKFCIRTASKDMTRPVLTCLHVTGRVVESSDNFRISRFRMNKRSGRYFPEPLLIPAKAVGELLKYQTPTQYHLTDGWIHFRLTEGAVFSSRRYQEKFPNVAKFLDQMKKEGNKLHLPELGDILTRAMIFTEEQLSPDEELVNVHIDQDKVRISANNEYGWFKESVKLSKRATKTRIDDPIRFTVHPGFLKEILSYSSKCSIGENAIKFDGKDKEKGTSWEYLVAIQQTTE